MSKLGNGDIHLLRLIARAQKGDGWATVSTVVWPLVVQLPGELRELRETEAGRFVRLTTAGETVLAWI